MNEVICLYLQVTRALHDLLSDRGIWVILLKFKCYQYRLFLPSYSIDSMDLVQLQRAATRPLRWARLVQRHSVLAGGLKLSSEGIKPVSSITMDSRRSQGSTSQSFLVPGGRFLFLIADSPMDRLVDLWDLGSAGQPPLDGPILIASLKWPPSAIKLGNYSIGDAGGGKLRIALFLNKASGSVVWSENLGHCSSFLFYFIAGASSWYMRCGLTTILSQHHSVSSPSYP